MIPGEGLEHRLESLQPFGICMTVADEDLRARWGSHRVPPFVTAEERLAWRDMRFGN